jgi:hypothetical protein
MSGFGGSSSSQIVEEPSQQLGGIEVVLSPPRETLPSQMVGAGAAKQREAVSRITSEATFDEKIIGRDHLLH